MRSTIRILLTATSVAGVTLPSAAIAADSTITEQDSLAARQTVGVAPSPRPETFRGVVASVDESSDTIKIRRALDTTDELKVQDGLLFSAVRYGDQVEVTVESIDGARTIVALKKE